jgi:hypothetical protein
MASASLARYGLPGLGIVDCMVEKAWIDGVVVGVAVGRDDRALICPTWVTSFLNRIVDMLEKIAPGAHSKERN